MRNRLYRDGREWTCSELSWPAGTRSWHSRDGCVFLTVHSAGRKRSGPGLWRWAASHQDSGRAGCHGAADTREAAMDAAVAATRTVREAYDGLLEASRDDDAQGTAKWAPSHRGDGRPEDDRVVRSAQAMLRGSRR